MNKELKSKQITKDKLRIISTVPSQTELLFDLGLDQQIFGLTKFCIHPEGKSKTKQRIGGTKNLNIPKILDLKPNLIIANKEENTKEQIEELQKHCTVYISDIKSIPDSLDLLDDIAALTGTEQKAEELKGRLIKILDKLRSNRKQSALYLIWKDPYMSVGNDSYIHSMMQHMGLINVLKDQKRYPALEIQDIKTLAPDLIILSSEPYPFKRLDLLALQEEVPNTKYLLLNAEIFSWYGSRLIHLEQEAMKLKAELENLSNSN